MVQSFTLASGVVKSLENDCGSNKATAAKLSLFVTATQSIQSPICSDGTEHTFERNFRHRFPDTPTYVFAANA